jgi:YfiH family protein
LTFKICKTPIKRAKGFKMLEIITSAALSPQHGFFTRKGGASSGIFSGLNCVAGSTDQAEVVAINRARVAGAMGVGVDHLVTVHQTHSAIALPISGPLAIRPEADGMACATKGVALGVLTADCQPVLFADARAGVIGAAHAGWKGAKDGVLEATLDAMEALGAARTQIAAVIGPCISQAAYEVGPEFYESFTDDDPSTRRFFANGAQDRMLFDLPSYGLMRLRRAGVGHAEWCGHCTYGQADRFYSYRRTTHLGEADYGRLISVIRL